jgi:uncharacterized protein YyaL (SSP411 family)
MTTLDFAVGPSVEIVIVGAPDAEATRDLVEIVRASYLPRSVTLLKAPGDQPALSAVAPWTDALVPAGDRATAYVCRDFRCELPATDPAALRRRLSADG